MSSTKVEANINVGNVLGNFIALLTTLGSALSSALREIGNWSRDDTAISDKDSDREVVLTKSDIAKMLGVDPDDIDETNLVITFTKKGDSLGVTYTGKTFTGTQISDDIKIDSNVEKSIQKAVAKIVADEWGEGNNMENSTKIQLSLKRVSTAAGDEIHLTRINCNSDLPLAVSTVNTMMNDSDFVDSIGPDEACYEVCDTGDQLMVNVMNEEIRASNCFLELFRYAYAMRDDVQNIHWNSAGTNFSDIHSFTDSIVWTLNSQIDRFAEWSVQYFGTMPHAATIRWNCKSVDFANSGATAEKGFEILKNIIDGYIASIELCYCNFDRGVQSVLDGMLEELRKDSDFFIKRRTLCK